MLLKSSQEWPLMPLFLTFIGLGISLFAYDIIVVMTPESYWRAAKIIPAIVVCYVIFASEAFAVLPILISGKTERLSYVNIIVGGVNICLNFWLIPTCGVNGAIWSTIISFVLKLVGIYCLGRRLYVIPYEWRRILISTVIAILVYYLGTFVQGSSWLVRVPGNFMLCLLFIGLIWVGVLDKKAEKTVVIRFLKEKFFWL